MEHTGNIFFYANFHTYDLTRGITRKVYSQIAAFRELGYSVTYCGYLEDGVGIYDNDDTLVYSVKYPVRSKKLQHVIRKGTLIKACIKYIQRTKARYTFAYARYHYFDRKYIKLLKTLQRHSDCVTVEAHSAPKFPKKLSLMKIVGWIDSVWNKKAEKYVDKIASMSDEDSLWGIRTFKIANGIDIETIKLHEYAGDPTAINFISVAFEREVHGYDRLINGMAAYYKNGGTRTIRFHIVGTCLPSTIKLIEKCGLQDKCCFYGPLAGDELDNAYIHANVGVGCLANHRIGSFYGSALKTKEYIAKGIPFIYGWAEKKLESFPYALKFDLCEDPIDMQRVIDFYDGLDKEHLAKTIRSCLSEEDTWLYQMKIVAENATGKENV